MGPTFIIFGWGLYKQIRYHRHMILIATIIFSC